jgi:hypothetical protein
MRSAIVKQSGRTSRAQPPGADCAVSASTPPMLPRRERMSAPSLGTTTGSFAASITGATPLCRLIKRCALTSSLKQITVCASSAAGVAPSADPFLTCALLMPSGCHRRRESALRHCEALLPPAPRLTPSLSTPCSSSARFKDIASCFQLPISGALASKRRASMAFVLLFWGRWQQRRL